MFIVSDDVLERLVCSSCKKYLSVEPIKVYPNRGIKCGRCSIPEDAGVNSLFGILAREALFRCVNRFDGCNQLLTYSEVAEHEQLCKSKQYDCPACTESFKGSAYHIYVHFKEKHQEMLLKDTSEFTIEVEAELQQTYLYSKNDWLFFVDVRYNKSNEEFLLNISHLGTEQVASKISQKVYLKSLDKIVKYTIGGKSSVTGNLSVNKIRIYPSDFPKNVVICRFAFDTENVDTFLALSRDCMKKGINAAKNEVKPSSTIPTAISGNTMQLGRSNNRTFALNMDFSNKSLKQTDNEVPALFSFKTAHTDNPPYIPQAKCLLSKKLTETNETDESPTTITRGLVSFGVNNDDLIDKLVIANYIRTPLVEGALREVDRADYFLPEARIDAYTNSAWKNGNLHLSGPSVYSEVMEGLKLRPGASFLNLGSGTGYLSTVAGLILGANALNWGIEIHNDVIEYAKKKLKDFKYSEALHFCKPKFFQGNCLYLSIYFTRFFDRIYCGAACPDQFKSYMKSLLKIDGILVIPMNDQLLQITRVSETQFRTKTLLQVFFVPLIMPLASSEASLEPNLPPIPRMLGGRINIVLGKKTKRLPSLNEVFKIVDRTEYILPEARSVAYENSAWKNGHLHLSSPTIYAAVMRELHLLPGKSFLNIGSGTGYLSTMAGLFLGNNGVNHGIEIQADVIEYANKKLNNFKTYSEATLEEYDFCEPKFVQGNGLCLHSKFTAFYDRIYCGAACPAQYEIYMKNLLNIGGILVMPINDQLVQVTRLSKTEWIPNRLFSVSFTILTTPRPGLENVVKPSDFMS